MAAEPLHISSRGNPLLVRLRKLAADPSAYRKHGVVLLEGDHLCAAWLARGDGPVLQAIVSERGWQSQALRDLAVAGAQIAVVADDAMAGVGTLESPPAVAFLVAVPAQGVVRASEPTVILDRVQDPGNVGSVLRSAAAFGYTQAIALTGTAALWSAKVVRAGMGAHFGMSLLEGADETVLDELAVPLLGTSSHAAAPIDQSPLPWPCAWVFGHEGQGVAPAIARRCRHILGIAQPGGGESINVAAAAAICLYETARQRSA